MKLILVPLLFLVGFAFLNQLGMGTDLWSNGGNVWMPSAEVTTAGWFDADSHMVLTENQTIPAGGEPGTMGLYIYVPDAIGESHGDTTWTNSTGTYPCYQVTGEEVLSPRFTTSFDMATSLGLIGVVVALVVIVSIATNRVFGTGDFAGSAIFKTSAYITIWSVFSVLSIGLITGIPILGPFFYLFLTIIYALGVVNSVGNPGND